MVRTQLLIVICLLFAPVAESSQCVFSSRNPTFTSGSGDLSVQLLPNDMAEIRSANDEETELIELNIDFPLHPTTGYVLESGEIILVGTWCGPIGLESTGVAVYTPAGALIWKKTIDAILPDLPGIFVRNSAGARWFSEIQLIEGSGIEDSALELRLISQDKLTINLAGGDTSFEPVNTAELMKNKEQAILWVQYKRGIGNQEVVLPTLEAVHELYPEYLEGSEQLAKAYASLDRNADAIIVLQSAMAYSPLLTSPQESSPKYVSAHSPISLRRDLAELYLTDKRFAEAKEILATLYALRPGVNQIVRDYAWSLFALEQDEKALKILDTWYEQLFTEYSESTKYLSSFLSDVQTMGELLKVYHHADLADAYLARVETLETDKTSSDYFMRRGNDYNRAGHYTQAIDSYKQAAGRSIDGNAETSIAQLYQSQPSIVENHLGVALAWYLKAVNKPGYYSSRFSRPEQALCYLFRLRNVSPLDLKLAYHWCSVSAENEVDAGYFWAAMYLGDNDGDFYSPTLARQNLLLARQGNYPGWGRMRDQDPNTFEADTLLKGHFKWSATVLAGPAFRDDPVANFTLGTMFQYGYGVEEDSKAAEQWLLKSAQGGYASGMLNLAHLYRKEAYKPQEAYYWFDQAALIGEEWGHYYMAKMLFYGVSGERDLIRARNELDLFSEIYMERERIRNQKYRGKYMSGLISKDRNPADDLYAKIAELEAKPPE